MFGGRVMKIYVDGQTLILNGWYTKNEKKEAFAAQKNWLRNYEYCKKKILIKELFCVNLLNPLCYS